MAATEIEKLERRYAENPQGLTFAPLAEVHRKNGEVPRALELLRAGLELHPNYIPASIVLGRCHWDLGDLPAAEAAFSHVLRLDDENVIALKSLADINERLERFSDAQRWLNRLISVDRSNEEARQQLARLESAKHQPALPPAAHSESLPAVQVQPAAALAPPPEKQEEKAGLLGSSTPKAEPEAAEAAPNLDLTVAIAGPAGSGLPFIDTSAPPEAPSPESASTPDAGPAPEEPAPVSGLISQEFVPPKDGAYRLHPELTHEYGATDSSGSDSTAPAEELEVETAAEVELQSSGASEFRVPNAAEDFMDAAAAPSVSPPAPEFEPEIVLQAPEPQPAAHQSAPPVAPAPQPPVAEAPQSSVAQAPEPRTAFSVRETRGQSVGLFFQNLLSARPAGAAAEPANTPPEVAPRGTGSAAQSGVPSASGSGSIPEAMVSFDDFFGAPASGSTPEANSGADPSKDDLDQFQSWLQNLKR